MIIHMNTCKNNLNNDFILLCTNIKHTLPYSRTICIPDIATTHTKLHLSLKLST
jgi:hypothetical protein